jgi:cell division protein FtsL
MHYITLCCIHATNVAVEMQQCIPFVEFSHVCTYKESVRTAQKMVLPIVIQQCISLVLFTNVELRVSDSNVKCIYFFSLSVRYFFPILSKLGFSQQMLTKIINIKFHANLSIKLQLFIQILLHVLATIYSHLWGASLYTKRYVWHTRNFVNCKWQHIQYIPDTITTTVCNI